MDWEGVGLGSGLPGSGSSGWVEVVMEGEVMRAAGGLNFAVGRGLAEEGVCCWVGAVMI